MHVSMKLAALAFLNIVPEHLNLYMCDTAM